MIGFRQMIRPHETERFEMASGPVKVIMRNGKVLKEPEIVQVKPGTDQTFYAEHRNRKAAKA